MSFEFIYNFATYKYDTGWIYKKKNSSIYEGICPVNIDLRNSLAAFSTEQLQTILCAVLHAYYHGYQEGQRAKVKEFKRVFDLD